MEKQGEFLQKDFQEEKGLVISDWQKKAVVFKKGSLMLMGMNQKR